MRKSWRDRLTGIAERHLGSVVVLAGIITWGLLQEHDRDRQINAYWGRVPGTLVRVETGGRGGPWAIFAYEVNGYPYEALSGRPDIAICQPLSTCIGKQFMVDYSTQDPATSRVNWRQPIEEHEP